MKVAEYIGLVRYAIRERVDPLPRYRLRLNDVVDTTSNGQKLMLLKVDAWDAEFKSWQSTQIALDLKRCRVAYGVWNNAALFNKQHKGSGMIGVMLLSFPFLLLFSPILVPLAWWYRRCERRWKMSVHAQALCRALSGQMDKETETLFVDCVQNDYAHDMRMRQRLSFEEAKVFLKKCDMVQEVIPPDESHDGFEYRGSYWHDAHGELVAQGDLRGEVEWVRVLGSFFSGKEAKVLRECFATADRRIHRRNAKL